LFAVVRSAGVAPLIVTVRRVRPGACSVTGILSTTRRRAPTAAVIVPTVVGVRPSVTETVAVEPASGVGFLTEAVTKNGRPLRLMRFAFSELSTRSGRWRVLVCPASVICGLNVTLVATRWNRATCPTRTILVPPGAGVSRRSTRR
jgi:hypothetical protein